MLGYEETTGHPIYRPGSGVVSGNGASGNPFVIAGWCISIDHRGTRGQMNIEDAAIRIEGTNAHVVIEENNLSSDVPDHLPYLPRSISDGINLIGTENVTLVDNRVYGPVTGIRVEHANGTMVEANTVQKVADAIRVGWSKDTRIAENAITEGHSGIRIFNSVQTFALDNTIEVDGVGISDGVSQGTSFIENTIRTQSGEIPIHDTSGTTLVGNTFHFDSPRSLELIRSSSATLKDNTFNRGGITVIAEEPSVARHNIDPSNTLDGDPIRYIQDRSNLTAPTPAGQVILVNTTSVTVEGLDLTNAIRGIQVFWSTNTTVLDNNLSTVLLEHAEGTAVHSNNFQDDDTGLYARSSATVNATRNWWGASSGPWGWEFTDACTGTAPAGDGADIRLEASRVCFDPWLTEPAER